MININIIAPNIKNGGGKELLEYLLEHLHERYQDIYVTVYLDNSMQHIKQTEKIKLIFLKTSIEKIRLFSKKIDNSLYFGNLPPLRKAKNSIVYFHNSYLLISLDELMHTSLKFCMKYLSQQLYIKYFIKNVDSVACQSNLIKEAFFKKYKYGNIELLPFFRLCNKIENISNVKQYNFCYVSLAHPHKNHKLLFDAMEILSKKGILTSLVVTIEDNKVELLEQIEKINVQGVVKINNVGVISKENVCQLYKRSRCLIFPSTKETFGLGLIEAAYMGIDVVAADLPYVYEVIEPSMVFNPNDAKMCAKIMESYMKKNIKKTFPLVKNKVDTLIQKLYKGE